MVTDDGASKGVAVSKKKKKQKKKIANSIMATDVDDGGEDYRLYKNENAKKISGGAVFVAMKKVDICSSV